MRDVLVSVVVPCRNEVHHIRPCIESLFRSHYPNLEVLVVDGMSEDGTREVLGGLTKYYSRLRVIDNVKKLTPYAFNLGVKAAHGNYIQIVGSRNVLSVDYIGKLVKSLKDNPNLACVGGDCQHIYETDNSKYIAWAMESKFGVGSSNFRTQNADIDVDTVGIPMIPRWVFEKIGFFDEDLIRNQDDEFSFRLRKAGYRIRYIHDAKVTYVVRSQYKKAYLQYYQYGYFKVFTNRKHGSLTTLRQIVPVAFVVFLFMSPFLVFMKIGWGWIVLSILLLYIGIGLVIAADSQWSFKERIYFLAAVFTLHLGYGIGYLNGILDFLILRRPLRTTVTHQTT